MAAVAVALAPVWILISQALAWARYGLDIPYYDDWRQYLERRAGSLDVGYLLSPVNGTVTAVGRALDSLALILFGGNVVVYGLLSMVGLLGALLILQWKLLRLGLGDVLLTAIAFLWTLASLRAATLWGGAENAFHQGMPIVLVLACLWMILRPGLGDRSMAVVVAGLCLVAGLTYISGAFGVVTAGTILLVCSFALGPPARARVSTGALTMLGIGVLTTAVQVYQVFLSAGGPGQRLTYPWDLRFWATFLGKIGGSLWFPRIGASQGQVLLTLAAAVAAAVLLAVAVAWCVLRLVRARPSAIRPATIPLTLLPLTGSVIMYLGLVSAARAEFQMPAGATLLDHFAAGRLAHHPFWVTLLWPWVAAVLITMAGTLARGRAARYLPVGALVVASIPVLVNVRAGSYDFGTWYAGAERVRTEVLDCLSAKLAAGERLYCQTGRPEWDLTDATVWAMERGASFTRYLEMVPARPDVMPLFDLRASGDAPLAGMGDVTATPVGTAVRVEGAVPAFVALTTGRAAELERCEMLEVALTGRTQPGAAVHVLWSSPRSPNVSSFSNYKDLPPSAEPTTIHLYLASLTGFADSLRLRITTTPFDIEGLEVLCRMARAADSP